MAFDLLSHRAADLAGKTPPAGAPERVERFRALVEQEQAQPHRLDQLAVDGNDLIEAGWAPGPALGELLDHLLGCVVGDPALNTRDWLLAEAERRRSDEPLR